MAGVSSATALTKLVKSSDCLSKQTFVLITNSRQIFFLSSSLPLSSPLLSLSHSLSLSLSLFSHSLSLFLALSFFLSLSFSLSFFLSLLSLSLSLSLSLFSLFFLSSLSSLFSSSSSSFSFHRPLWGYALLSVDLGKCSYVEPGSWRRWVWCNQDIPCIWLYISLLGAKLRGILLVGIFFCVSRSFSVTVTCCMMYRFCVSPMNVPRYMTSGGLSVCFPS